MQNEPHTLTPEILRDLVDRRLVIRGEGIGQSLEIQLLAGLSSDERSEDKTLVELTYFKNYHNDEPLKNPSVKLSTYSKQQRDEKLSEQITDWQNKYPPMQCYCATWTQPKEVVITGWSHFNYRVELPPDNIFFLQAMVEIKMWLTIAAQLYPALTGDPKDCPFALLGAVLIRVAKFIEDQNRELSKALVFTKFPMG